MFAACNLYCHVIVVMVKFSVSVFYAYNSRKNMRTPDCIYNFMTAPFNRFGIFTRRNCVDKATQIGKELVDITGTETLTKEVIESVVKKHAKGIKLPNLATTSEEAIELSVKCGMPSDCFVGGSH